jgi:hypothetical protein
MSIVATAEKETESPQSLVVPVYVTEDTGAALSRASAKSAAITAANSYSGETWAGPGFGPDTLTCVRLSYSSYRVTITYNVLSAGTLQPTPTGSANYTFQFNAQPVTRLYSLQTLARAPASAPSMNGLLNVPYDGSAVQPVTINPPPATDRIEYAYAGGFITGSYRTTVRRLMGKIATGAFLGEPAGCFMLVECHASRRSDGDFMIAFGFAFDEAKSITMGTLTLNAPPHSYVWSQSEPDFDPTNRVPLLKPRYAYAERIWQSGDFSALGLPGF